MGIEEGYVERNGENADTVIATLGRWWKTRWRFSERDSPKTARKKGGMKRRRLAGASPKGLCDTTPGSGERKGAVQQSDFPEAGGVRLKYP